MMPSLIFVFSVGALLQFAVSYCRTLLLDSSAIALSKRVQEFAGIRPKSCSPLDFDRVMQLIRFAAPSQDDAGQMRAVTIYYRLTRIALALVAPVSREASSWLQNELSRCTHFAAVALDRRIATATSQA